MWVALTFSILAALYNNVANRWGPFHSWAYVPLNLAAVGLAVVAASRLQDLGTTRLGLRGDAVDVLPALGLVALFAIGVFAVARSRLAHLIADKRVTEMRGGALAFYVLVRIPLGTAVTEEVLFRGLLFALWREAGLSSTAAALAASVVFGLWHIAPTAIGVRVNDVSATKTKVAVAVMGAVAATAIAGLVLTWLRVTSGGLVAPVLLHAGVNSTGALAAAHAGSRSNRDTDRAEAP